MGIRLCVRFDSINTIDGPHRAICHVSLYQFCTKSVFLPTAVSFNTLRDGGPCELPYGLKLDSKQAPRSRGEKAITSPDRTGSKVYYQSGSRTDCIFYYQSGRKCVIVPTEAGFVGTGEGSSKQVTSNIITSSVIAAGVGWSRL